MSFLSFCHKEHEEPEAEPGRGQVESGQTRKPAATVCIACARECWCITTAISEGLHGPWLRRSRDQLLPVGLGHGLGAVARPELVLRLLEVTAHGLLPEFERLGNLCDLPPR